jgi:TPR repeat protein
MDKQQPGAKYIGRPRHPVELHQYWRRDIPTPRAGMSAFAKDSRGQAFWIWTANDYYLSIDPGIGTVFAMSRFIIFLFALIYSGAIYAAAFEDAVSEYYTGSRTHAVGIQRLAQKGDVNAQAFLGSMYASGEGVRKDYQAAIKWQTRAANQGHARAQYNLAVMYSRGLGVPQELPTAARWFEAAASQGLPEARMHLGLFHEKGWVLQKCPYAASEEYYQAGQDFLQRGDLKGARAAAKAIETILPNYYLSKKLYTEIYMYE